MKGGLNKERCGKGSCHLGGSGGKETDRNRNFNLNKILGVIKNAFFFPCSSSNNMSEDLVSP